MIYFNPTRFKWCSGYMGEARSTLHHFYKNTERYGSMPHYCTEGFKKWYYAVRPTVGHGVRNPIVDAYCIGKSRLLIMLERARIIIAFACFGLTAVTVLIFVVTSVLDNFR